MTVLVDTLCQERIKSRGLYNTLCVGVGFLLMVLSGSLRIPLPFTPVPITMQTLSVFLVAYSLGSRRGALSLIAYTAWNAPFLMGPTAGYFVGMILAAYAVGWSAERGYCKRYSMSLLVFTLASLLILGFGVLWLGFVIGTSQAMVLGFYPFIVGDIFKIVLAASLLPTASKVVSRFAP